MPEVSARTAGTLVAAAGVALGAPHVTHTLEYAGDAAAVAVHVVVPIALAAVLVAAGYLLAAERLVPEGEVARALGWLLVGVAVLEFMTAWMLAGVVVDGGIVPEPSEALLNAATVGGLVGLLVGVYDGRVRHQQRYVDQLNRINNTLRIASQELVHADSRKEIERAVCTRLTESDPYDSAWVGRHDRERSRVVPSTWAGIDDEYVESIVITVDDSPTGNGPGGQAIKTGELQAIQNVLDDPSAEPWRDLFESEGVESLAVVPFVHGDTVYGFVSLYANRPNVFDDRERQVLAELGETVGHAIHSIETRDRLAARERDLERQNERLEQFAGVVSHDLRNPLNTAEGYLDLAREDGDGEHLDRVATALDRMNELIEDVLTLARQGQTVSERETVDMESLVEAAWGTAGHSEATLEVDGDLGRLDCDASRVRQLFENLFRNSVEHVGTDVTVTVGRLPDGFYVADDGPGIPPEDRETVFEAGYSTTREGTGFGLNIVETLATAHGWTVALTESEAGGTRFEFTGVDAWREEPTRAS